MSSANLMIELEACLATQSWVNRECRRGLRTLPREGAEHAPLWGHSVEGQRSGDVVSYFHHLGVARQNVQDPIVEGEVETQGLQLDDKLGGLLWC